MRKLKEIGEMFLVFIDFIFFSGFFFWKIGFFFKGMIGNRFDLYLEVGRYVFIVLNYSFYILVIR